MKLKKEIKTKTSIETGLTTEQFDKSLKNVITEKTGKSYSEIIREHVLTLFNTINVFLAILVIITGSIRNMTFMGVVVINAIVGIVQEIRSKKTLDHLALLNQPHVKVLRNSQEMSIPVEEIVENDILILSTGDQICVDGICVDGKIECNESMLTGESDLVTKGNQSPLFSGSFVVSGKAKMQVLCVGSDTYAYSILSHAKREKRYPSKLRDNLQAIIQFCTIVLIPAGILLFLKSFLPNPSLWKEAILSMVAAVVGMIPEGLVFLTSLALAIGAMKLARQKVLIQELYCIETLARVDMFCLDKTGTITKGEMKVEKIHSLKKKENEIKDILSRFYYCIQDQNDTAKAIRNYTGTKECKSFNIVPFSSTRKASAVQFEDGWYILGAYPFIVNQEDESYLSIIEDYAKEGYRVLTLGFTKEIKEENLKCNPEILGFILIRDVLRDHIQEIIEYFYKQDVNIRVISGDDCQTVAAIAHEAGIIGNAVDMSHVENVKDVLDDYSIFGRVTPEQKRDMVIALKEKGYTVAMTGDGVNDVMALKEADCSIAMGSGSEATKSIASIVLLDSQFEAMPDILLQGRCIINNITRSAALFLVKTLFSFGVSIFTLVVLSKYPFKPIQLTLISALATGIPSFVLTLEPDENKVYGNFLYNVFSRALPGGLCVVLSVVGCTVFSAFVSVSSEQFSTICTYLAGFNALCVLASVCVPMTKIRLVLLHTMLLAFVGAVFLFPSVFYLVPLTFSQWIYVLVNGCFIPFFLFIVHNLMKYYHNWLVFKYGKK